MSNNLPATKQFRVIYADPPWSPGQQGPLGAIRHYDLLDLETIKALPVDTISAPDSVCFLWVTNAVLVDGYDVLRAWGFTPYKTPLTWTKPRLGLGTWLRSSTEHLLIGTRGKIKPNFRSQPSWLLAPVAQHSVKPDEIYAIIQRLADGPYLELFARRRPPSDKAWSVWGLEIDADIHLPGFPVPSDFDDQPTGNHDTATDQMFRIEGEAGRG